MSTITSKENSKFPKWDIIPPFQFINPRIRTENNQTEKVAEVKKELPRTVDSEVKNTKRILTNIPEILIKNEMQKCPACEELNNVETKFCKNCGLKLSVDEQEPEIDEDTNVAIIKCIHCGEELELDESEDAIGTYQCPTCGKEFDYTG